MNTNIKSVHPFADAFPMMTDEEMTRLVDDIKQHGQIEPCIVNSHGVLLDGRNRRAACEQLGIEPEVRYVNPESETAFILSSNVARRHLSASQLGVIALASLPHFEAEARARQGARSDLCAPGHTSPKARATDEAARAAGISGRTVARANRVAEQAPELLEEVKVGNLTLKAAERELVERQAEDSERQQILMNEVGATLDAITRKPTKPDLGGGISHPARYSDPLIPIFAELLETHSMCEDGFAVLDPFAGTGKIHKLREYGFNTIGIEIEPEWAAMHDGTTVGDALALPYSSELATGSDSYGSTFSVSEIGAICTSPTYGNRLADHHNASDPESRRSYTHDLGRELHPNNSGAMHWGDDYRAFHERAWAEAVRVLMWNGVFILNIKDFIRNGEWQHVTNWHLTTLASLGLRLLEVRAIPLRGLRHGANASARVPFETVAIFKKTP